MTPERTAAVRTAIRKVEASVSRYARDDSEDIVQEALARAVRHGVDCEAEPWLRTVAKRIAIDRSRRALEVASGGSAELELLSPGAESDPEDVILANETFGAVREAMAAMPARYRDALLTYAKTQEAADVSQYFGISPTATWTLISRARARLRLELDRVGYAFGVLAVRLPRWHADPATACAALCVAAAVGLSNGAADPKPAVDVRTPVATATATVSAPPHVPDLAKPAPTRPMVEAPAAAVAVTVEPTPEKVVHYEVAACGFRGNEVPVGVGVTVIDDEQKSLVGQVLEAVPEPLRMQEVGGC